MIDVYDSNEVGKWSDQGKGLAHAMMGLGNIGLMRNNLYLTVPGKNFGQGGLLSVRNTRLSHTRSFESPKLHKQLRSNKEYSKECEFIFFRIIRPLDQTIVCQTNGIMPNGNSLKSI